MVDQFLSNNSVLVSDSCIEFATFDDQIMRVIIAKQTDKRSFNLLFLFQPIYSFGISTKMTYKLYLRIPHFLAIDRAVLILSPVTIRTVIPAFLHFRIASGTSSRTGSSIPTIAMRVRSAIILSSSSQSLPSAGRFLIDFCTNYIFIISLILYVYI